MNGGVKHGSQLNHLHRAGDRTSFTPESGEPVPLRHIVAFDQMGLCFGLYKQFRRNHIVVDMPMVAEIDVNVPCC